MQTLGKALTQLIQELGIEHQILRHQAILLWPKIVGDKIARISSAEKIEQNILFVKVANDSWRNELFYLKRDIIEKLNQRLGKRVIEEIRFY